MAEAKPSYVNMRDAAIPLDIAPVSGRIGAELGGLQMSGDLDDAAVAAIKAALVRHKVLFFRGQDMLDDDRHEAFARLFGQPYGYTTLAMWKGSEYLIDLDSSGGYSASSWHTDSTFVDCPPQMGILRVITAPEAGGDTLFANTAAAYHDLPGPLKLLVDDLWAIHSNRFDYVEEMANNREGKKLIQSFASVTFEAEHPVVHIHPESGERALLLGHFFNRFVGLSRSDSQILYERLQSHITKPENTVRWRWRVGDVAIWDNRTTQHRAIADYGTQPRHHRRATVAGTVPVSIDGRRSRMISPAPEQSAQAAE